MSPKPLRPEPPRTMTTWDSVELAFEKAKKAHFSGEEMQSRTELRLLEAEAGLLARTYPMPLPPATEGQRLRIAAERAHSGRAA